MKEIQKNITLVKRLPKAKGFTSILYPGERKNKTYNLTEYYNLIYAYQNDCLEASIEYNKDFYRDRDIEPSENLLFKLTITPLAQINSPNLIKK